MWDKILGGEGLNYTRERELKQQHFDFLYCKLDGKELSCKESGIWGFFKALYLTSAPSRALIHVFNNPSAREGYLLWANYLRNWNSLHPISTEKSKYCQFK